MIGPWLGLDAGDTVEILASLSTFHRFWGNYVVPIAAVIGLIVAIAGWLGALQPRLAARRAALLYIIAIDLQLLLGIVIWVGLGGMALARPYRLEHPLIMILAVVALHGGQVLAKRARSDKAAARTIAIAIAVSFVLVLVGIPGLVTGR
jgi:hypothetical protein